MDLSKLLDYSDDDDEDDGDNNTTEQADQRPAQSPRPAGGDLPALPSAFHNLYASSARVSVTDDSSLHGGRVRQVPHVEGNYSTHVYIECKEQSRDLAPL